MEPIQQPTVPTEPLPNTPEHEVWASHLHMVRDNMSHDHVGFRGCLGLAMMIDSTRIDTWLEHLNLRFVHDRDVRWASLVDIPKWSFFSRWNNGREVHWATVRPTTVKFGMPRLEYASEGHQAWDFRSLPHPNIALTSRGGVADPERFFRADTLPSDRNTRYFRVFNALEWAMTSTAVHFHTAWQKRKPRSAFYKTLGYVDKPDQQVLLYGGGVYDGAAPPVQWMPRAYLAFRADDLPRLFDRVTLVGGADSVRKYSQGFQYAFAEAMTDYLAYRAPFAGTVKHITHESYLGIPALSFLLVGNRGERQQVRFFRQSVMVGKGTGSKFERGDVIAYESFEGELPDTWHSESIGYRFHAMAHDKLLRGRFVPVVRLWFERQALSLLPHMIHMPAQVASVAALGSALDSHLYWEVSESLEYYRDDSDAMVFPPLHIRGQDDLTGILPGDVAYDLRPYDGRYSTYAEMKARSIARREAEAARQAENPDEPLPQPIPRSKRRKSPEVTPVRKA